MGDENLLIPEDKEHYLKAYKSFYYQQCQQTDNIQKIFTSNIKVTKEDLVDINDRVIDKFKHFESAGFSINTNVKFDNKSIKEFGTWESFIQHQWIEPNAISSLTISWDINLILPNYDQPQRHHLTLKLSNSMRPEEILKIIFSGGIDDIEDLDKTFFPAVARIEYIDLRLGQELINIVEEWVDGLKKVDQFSKIVESLKKVKLRIATFIEVLTNLLGFGFLSYFMVIFIERLNFDTLGNLTNLQTKQFFLIIISAIVLLNFLKKFSNYLAKTIYNLLSDYGNGYIFDITKGDRKLHDKMQKHEFYAKVKFFIHTTVIFLFNVISAIFSTKIMSVLS